MDGAARDQDALEQLSQWLNAFDAVKLHAVQQPVKAARVPQAAERPAGATALEAEFHRVRSALVKGQTVPEVADADGYTPYRQRYAEHQRQMELKIAPLRERVRQALSRVSPGLKQLAMLDAVFDQTLAAREQRLLSKVPVLLERRFDVLRQTQRAGGFGREWQDVLLAELNLRLLPVVGMMEAMGVQPRKQQ